MARQIGLIIGMLLLVGLAWAEEGATNLVKNGGFEQAAKDVTLPVGWRRWQSKPDTAYRDLENPHKGSASLTIKTNIKGGWQVMQQDIICQPETTYELRFFCKQNHRVKGTASVIYYLPGEKKKSKSLLSKAFSNPEWAAQRMTFTTPPVAGDGATIKVMVRFCPSPWKVEGGQIWVDEVTITKVAPK